MSKIKDFNCCGEELRFKEIWELTSNKKYKQREIFVYECPNCSAPKIAKFYTDRATGCCEVLIVQKSRDARRQMIDLHPEVFEKKEPEVSNVKPGDTWYHGKTFVDEKTGKVTHKAYYLNSGHCNKQRTVYN